MHQRTRLFIVLLFLGLLVRLLLVPQPGFEGDIGFWKSWSKAASENGPVWVTLNTDYNYPAGFTWVLWLVGKVYRIFKDPNNQAEFFSPGNYFFLFLIKLVPVVSDLLIAFLIFQLISEPEKLKLPAKASRFALPLAGIYLFHPIVLFDGVWWGQVDSFGVLFAFLTLYFLTKEKTKLATISLTTGFLLKMQNIIFLPLYFLFLARKYSRKEMVQNLAWALFTYLLICSPFLLSRNLERTFTLILNNTGWFPYLSLRAYNFWWLVAKGNWTASDNILTFGITSALTLGRGLFFFVYFLTTILIFLKPAVKNLLFAFAFSSFAFFFLPTQSHERYLFPFVSLSLPLLPFIFLAKNPLKARLGFLLGLIFSFTGLINLNNSLIHFYPKNGWPLLAFFNRPQIETLICFFNFIVLIVLLKILVKQISFIKFLLVFCLFFGGWLLTNLGYLAGRPVSLTKFKPLIINQGFGSLQINRNLASSAGWKSWSFLSVNHFFYKKGLATHANSKLAYDLKGRFGRFTADYGVDSDAGSKASVIFSVVGDNRILFTSSVVKKADLPQRIDLPVKGIQTLELLVSDAGDGISDDHADWLNPTLYR